MHDAHTYIYTYLHTYLRTYVLCTWAYVRMFVNIVRMHAYVLYSYVRTCAYGHGNIRTNMGVGGCVIHTYVCTYLCTIVCTVGHVFVLDLFVFGTYPCWVKCLIEIVTPFDTHVRTTGFHVLYICFCVFVPSAGVYMG